MDAISIVQYLAALALVIALILGLAWILRRSGFAPMVRTPRGKRRLEVLEVLPLDPKRRLALVRCDAKAHLLLLGADGDLVVATDLDAPRFEAALPPATLPETTP